MRTILTLALAATISFATLGAASAASRSFEFTGFERIDIATGLNAVVTFGDTFLVTADSTNQEALDKLEVVLDGTTLSARLEQSFFDFLTNGGLLGDVFGGDKGITINITLPVLTGANASSGADVTITAPTGDLDLNVSSGGDLTLTQASLGAVKVNVSSGAGASLSGTCDSIALNASSGSDIDANGLSCRNADANASSGGDISISVSDSLKANASSGGDIDVSGNPPKTDIESSSGGDVRVNG